MLPHRGTWESTEGNCYRVGRHKGIGSDHNNNWRFGGNHKSIRHIDYNAFHQLHGWALLEQEEEQEGRVDTKFSAYSRLGGGTSS